jgi:hypothetical protein
LTIQSALYWSATTKAVFPSLAWVVNFGNGFVGLDNGAGSSGQPWCVRGGMNADPY